MDIDDDNNNNIIIIIMEEQRHTVPEFLDLTFLGVDGDLGGDISASTSSVGPGSSSHSSFTERSAQKKYKGFQIQTRDSRETV